MEAVIEVKHELLVTSCRRWLEWEEPLPPPPDGISLGGYSSVDSVRSSRFDSLRIEGEPDRGYARAVREADMWLALKSLRPLEYKTGELHKQTPRARGWMARVIGQLRHFHSRDWVDWCRAHPGRPYYNLVDFIAELMALQLGGDWL